NSAVLLACARRVRGDGSVRGQRGGCHAHDAARDLHGVQWGGCEPGLGGGALAAAHRRRGRDSAVPAQLAGGALMLAADVVVRLGMFELDAAIQVARGETVAVMGPNGSGKSTLLGAIAGLLAVQTGTVSVGERMLTAPSVHVRPESRRVGLLGQDPFLFPHLSALENIAFGPR